MKLVYLRTLAFMLSAMNSEQAAKMGLDLLSWAFFLFAVWMLYQAIVSRP